MNENQLIIYKVKKRKYSSYKSEISSAIENLINREFHAVRLNKKWLTYITEFYISAGKVNLSPIIDCFDSMIVAWSVRDLQMLIL